MENLYETEGPYNYYRNFFLASSQTIIYKLADPKIDMQKCPDIIILCKLWHNGELFGVHDKTRNKFHSIRLYQVNGISSGLNAFNRKRFCTPANGSAFI